MHDARRMLVTPPDSPAIAGELARGAVVPPSMRAPRAARRADPVDGAPTGAADSVGHDDPASADAPSPELVGLLDRLRSAIASYVGGRRAAGVPVERVLAEVQHLARAAAVCEGWYDFTELLVPRASAWARAAYDAPWPTVDAPRHQGPCAGRP
jgi:hypothetical protein